MAEREFIVKEWRDDKGILHIREVGQELVRCKECKRWGTDDCFMCNECQRNPCPTTPDDFCSYGERREP